MAILDLSSTRQHHVYMLVGRVEGSVFVKIGRSSNIFGRMALLIKQSPFPLQKFHYVEVKSFGDSVILERLLHKAYHTKRVKGEWFKFDPHSEKDEELFLGGWRFPFHRMDAALKWEGMTVTKFHQMTDLTMNGRPDRRQFLFGKALH